MRFPHCPRHEAQNLEVEQVCYKATCPNAPRQSREAEACASRYRERESKGPLCVPSDDSGASPRALLSEIDDLRQHLRVQGDGPPVGEKLI